MSRPRQLPNLNSYLKKRSESVSSLSSADGFGCLASLGLGTVASYYTYIETGFIPAFLAFFGAMILSFMALSGVIKKISRPRNQNQERKQRLDKAITALSEKARTGNYRKILDPHAAAILEFASKQWIRIKQNLDDPAWTVQNLPSHWKQVKQNAENSAEQALGDLVLLLSDGPIDQMSKSDWFYVYETCLDALIDPTQAITTPPEFDVAIDIAQKTRKLASELDAVLEKVKGDSDVRAQLAGRSTIDSMLEELQALQKAEAELDQEHFRLEDR